MNWYEKSKLCGRFRRLNPIEKMRIYYFRQNPTPAEAALWKLLRNKRLNGYKFRRQHKIGQCIVDFYCHKAGLVVEVDGGIHQKRKRADEIRTAWFTRIGLSVLRFSNTDILTRPGHVRDSIVTFLKGKYRREELVGNRDMGTFIVPPQGDRGKEDK